MAPSFNISYPGLTPYSTGNSTVTLSHGSRPSAFTIEVADVYEIVRQVGDVTLEMNGRVVVRFPECAIDGIFKGAGGEGTNRYTVRILDRRWKWWKGRGVISGAYNVRKPRLSFNSDTNTIPQQLGILPETKKTPQELAKICLEALGETGYDVSQLPNRIDERTAPEVRWDHVQPAEALDEIVSKLGCRIVLGTDNRVRICRVGSGNQLPPGAVKSQQNSIESAAVPDSLIFIAGPTIYQGLLKLEPVGIDIDGEIKPIKDLKYTPEGGWESYSANAPELGVRYGKTVVERDRARALAQQCIWKWYRVVGQLEGKLGPVPGYKGEVDKLWQYSLRNTVLDTTVSSDGVVSIAKPRVIGRWAEFRSAEYDSNTATGTPDSTGNTPENSPYPEDFSIDEQNSVVTFNRPLYRYFEKEIAAAEIYLYTSYQIRDRKTRAFDRYTKEQRMPGTPSNTGPYPFKVEDVYRTVVVDYEHTTANGYRNGKVTENSQELESVSQFYLAAQQYELVPEVGLDQEYDQFVNISPDGAIQQVTWQLSDAVASTRASRNIEHSVIIPRYHQRQVMSQIQTINQKLDAIKKMNEA